VPRLDTFGDYARRWPDDAVHLRAGTREKYAGHLSKHLIPAFGDRALDTILPSHVRSFVAASSRTGAARATVAAVYRTFAQVMKTAEIDRLIERSPCLGIKLPRDEARREICFLGADEIGRLSEVIHLRYKALILTAAYSGMRFGELAFLRPDAVNVLSGRIEVRGSLADIGGRLIEQPTKTNRMRAVTLPRSVAQILGQHIGQYPAENVFSAPRGGPIRRRAWYARFFRPAVAKAGLDPALRFHDLRHSHAALLIAAGLPVKVIADRLGHVKPSLLVALDLGGADRGLKPPQQGVVPALRGEVCGHHEHLPPPQQTGGRNEHAEQKAPTHGRDLARAVGLDAPVLAGDADPRIATRQLRLNEAQECPT
jgi:integrase